MKITTNVPTLIEDNGFELLDFIKACIQYSDPECQLQLLKMDNKIIVHIIPSNSIFRKDIIQNLLYINKVFKTQIKFSSSLAISKKVSFEMLLENEKKY